MNEKKLCRKNLYEGIKLIRKNLVFYLPAFLLILGIKFFYSKAGSDDLLWILAPTARWVSILSGIPFVYEPNAGYVNHSLRFIIAPSCSGVQFMLITITTLIFSFVHRMNLTQESSQSKEIPDSHGIKKGVCWTLTSILASYLLTIFVNGLRIILSIYIPVYFREQNLYGSFLTPERLHTIIGTVVYFVSLLTIYHLGGYISLKTTGQTTGNRLPKHTACTHITDTKTTDQDKDCTCAADDDRIDPRKTNCSIAATCRTDLNSTYPYEAHNNNGSDSLMFSIIRKCMPPVFWYFFIVLGIPFLNKVIHNDTGYDSFAEYAALITIVCTIVLCLFCLMQRIYKQHNH